MQNNKITDQDTNYIYLSDLLKNRFPAFYTKLTAIFNKHKIKYDLLKGTKDIWCRDYMPIQISKNKFVRFRYDPDYLVGHEHLKTDPGFVCDSIEIKPIKSELIIDGGNVIKSKDSVILTDKIVKENKNIEKEILFEKLSSLFETENIIIIPHLPYDDLGHADGMLRYYNESTVIANDFSKTNSASFQDRFKKSLEKCGLNIKTFPYKPVFEKNKDSIFVATGVYINYLRVNNLILFPTFDIAEDDIALKEINKLYPNASIEPIDSKEIAYHGGVLNCISWTVFK